MPSRKIAARLRELFYEAADVVEAVRRLWDSWEDDAEIRDAATGRFLDRDKVHHIGFEGRWFSVKGPSITPRGPQGQPPVVSLAHASVPYAFAAAASDVVTVTPHDREGAAAILGQVDAAVADAGRDRTERPLRVLADLLVVLDERPGAAARRLARLDERAGTALRSDAEIFTGTPAELAGLARRRPGRLPPPPRRPAARPDGDHPGPGPRTPAPRRLPHGLRQHHPPRPPRSAGSRAG